MSLRLTFCLSPQTQSLFLYILVYKCNSSQCGLQYCRSSQHKKLALYISLFTLQTQWCTKRGDLHYLRNMTTAFLNIRKKQPRMWLKMFVWVNLSITLYMCTVMLKCVYLLLWHFVYHWFKIWMVAETAEHQGVHNY